MYIVNVELVYVWAHSGSPLTLTINARVIGKTNIKRSVLAGIDGI